MLIELHKMMFFNLWKYQQFASTLSKNIEKWKNRKFDELKLAID